MAHSLPICCVAGRYRSITIHMGISSTTTIPAANHRSIFFISGDYVLNFETAEKYVMFMLVENKSG